MRSNKAKLLIAAVIAVIAIISYYSKTQVNPVTGEKQRVSLTPQQEIVLGLQSAPEMINQMGGEVRDPKINNYVESVGQKIVSGTEAGRSEYKFDFHVLADQNTVNAFALPGGQIFITMGLLKMLENEDQLAGILGHEIGHVIGRHGAEQMAKQELTQGLISAADIALTEPGSPNAAAMISRYVAGMINMKYGREDELESDRFAVKYMHETGYEPAQMIEVMHILDRAAGGKAPPEFLSTHPNPDNRIDHIKAEIDKLGR
ncbi:MAG: M48 family metalloprotease [Ignavibacteria bacterium]|nr:M48 family metalloprotease [Ignavibacteria bacterium]